MYRFQYSESFILSGLRRKPCWMQYEYTKYSPHGLEMLEKQKLCKDYIQDFESSWKLCDASFLTSWERESHRFNNESTSNVDTIIRAVARGKRPPLLGKDVFYRSKVMLNDGFINAIGKIISGKRILWLKITHCLMCQTAIWGWKSKGLRIRLNYIRDKVNAYE